MTHAEFAPLAAAYADRLALLRSAKAAGSRVVGYVGNTVPVELIRAAGCVPLRIAPLPMLTTVADVYIEPIADPDVRWIFELYCTGALDALDLLVIPRSTESQHKLFLSIREALRTGVVSAGPELWLYDIPHTQRASSAAYGLDRTRALADRLGTLVGQPVSDARLRHAIAEGNQRRQLLAQLQAQRWTEPCSGAEGLVASSAWRFMHPAEAEPALLQWLHTGGPERLPTGPGLLVRGVPLEHSALHRLVEQLGARIVAEDDDWGARAGAPLISTVLPPLQAVFEYYWRDVPCVRIQPPDDRWFHAALQQPAVQGVIFHLPEPDDIYGWSYPPDAAIVARAGLPHLVVRHDVRDERHLGAIQRELQSFIESLRAKTPAAHSPT
ncbi:2-hydroxyacyl-CoA dehydratase family protein [Roseateles paludis]|uniref:2-hydroxyacyl-CoA dehydratase family protein n=1 Tax=Roseateles paludis TaxID=3145238 RepID=A0ABV0G554_9BURK